MYILSIDHYGNISDHRSTAFPSADASSATKSSGPYTVIVSIHQEDERCVGAPPYLDIGVTVLQVK